MRLRSSMIQRRSTRRFSSGMAAILWNAGHSVYVDTPMKRHWIEYQSAPVTSPMTYWVHREADGKPWYLSKVHDPPFQPVVPAKGYPQFFVEYGDFTFTFASLAEVRAAIEVLGRKVLPTTRRLGAERGMGPNKHWLSRLPDRVMAWRYRQAAVEYIAKALTDFERELGHPTA